MKKILGLMMGIALLAVLSSPVEASFQWDVAPTVGATINFDFVNYEAVRDSQVDNKPLPTADGDILYGIFLVKSIFDVNDPGVDLWVQGDGKHIVGYFDDYVFSAAKSSTLPLSNDSDANFTGGMMKMFFDDSAGSGKFDKSFGSHDGGVLGHGRGYDGDIAANSNFELLLSMVGVGGVVGTDLTITLNSDVDVASPIRVSGGGFLDAVDGSLEDVVGIDAMDPLGIGGTTGDQDVSFQSNVNPGGLSGWPAESFDPMLAVYVPEPASVLVWAVLGVMGVLGCAIRRRRGK